MTIVMWISIIIAVFISGGGVLYAYTYGKKKK
ncbi:hypothetical protein V070_00946 [Staphylococcus aureus C0673]|nr:hypothetical protein V070_00946 [Staphylococcus aureus C0673]